MLTHAELVNQMLQNPNVKAEYEALEPEFALLDELLRARTQAGLTPAEVAQRLGTTTPVITRLEAGVNNTRSPSLTLLRKLTHLTHSFISQFVVLVVKHTIIPLPLQHYPIFHFDTF